MRIGLVLWGGTIGGAESFTAALARTMAAQGAEPHVLFVLESASLATELDRSGIPHSELGLPRGRAVLRRPRRFARVLSAAEPDVAILSGSGYLAAGLRAGGFRPPIVAIEHGSLLQLPRMHPLRQMIVRADRLSGVRACSAVVAVSEYVKERIEFPRLRRRIVYIPNGVDLDRFSPSAADVRPQHADGRIVIGCGSRFVQGKGVEDIIRALSHPVLAGSRLRLAGEGPHAQALHALAQSLNVDDRVEFLGPLEDMPEFWRSIDIGVVPSNGLVESFGMAAIEAMACGKPVVVSDSGALPSIVTAGETGQVVPAGNVTALANALGGYVRDPAAIARHGLNGRRRCEAKFAIEQTASRYLDLCSELVRTNSRDRMRRS
jgi:glycosyltransferase involved in cell wall biosynthesis